MKGQLTVTTPEQYLAAVDAARRDDVMRLHQLIVENAPRLAPVIHSGMLGYGLFHYRYASGREGDATKLAVASNKGAISLYCLAADAKGYVAERYAARLPKASIGKSCVRLKRLSDVDEGALIELIRETANTPYGEAETGASETPRKASAKKPAIQKAPAKKRA
jgi:hypothetical protein